MIIHNKIQSISSEEINEESDNLEKNDSLTLINYIKNSIDVFVQILVEQKVQEYKETKKNSQEEYETLLIKLESDIRSHISTEHVLKLEAENMQYEIEDLERENQRLKGSDFIDTNVVNCRFSQWVLSKSHIEMKNTCIV